MATSGYFFMATDTGLPQLRWSSWVIFGRNQYRHRLSTAARNPDWFTGVGGLVAHIAEEHDRS